jgi:ribosome-associated protein
MKQTDDRALAALVERLGTVLDDGKAVDVRVLDVRRLTVITDYMLIASGRSARQVRALTDRVLEAARAAECRVVGVEGATQGEWVLVDLGGVVVHLMQPDAREFYQLEKLWEERSAVHAADAG